ncbi:retinoic acid receptor RXR-alpha-B-like [Ruditapes philippinarum]|uniref:retinoic acid receptor RXR-alpha-B-like n=1 Tax=Ruditapes philippinarum TaxID=129788 RepID=UPI00295A5E0F|nr:retinoic acid receptor RXR-alpha-B-like [Ruditapes philippinarum]
MENVDLKSDGDTSLHYTNSDDSEPDGYPEAVVQTDISSPPMPHVVQGSYKGVKFVIESNASEVVAGDSTTVGIGGDAVDEGQGHFQACMICGDRGSGYHYSVLSCEGCKGFFKRTVQKNLFYVCKVNGVCLINKMTRNNCQFCRFQKCLQYGMKREAVREDRSPGGKHRTKKPRFDSSMEDDNFSKLVENKQKLEDDHNELINVLLASQPDKIPDNEFQGRSASEISIEELMQFGYSELKYIIEWAKKVPNFRLFTMEDQMALLKSAFMELNVIRLSYRSMEYDDALRFADNIIVPRSVCATMGWGQELVHATLEFATRLKELDLDKVEFALMNAIVLTYPDAIGLSDKSKVIGIQTKFLDTLRRYVCVKYSSDKGRFGKLLLRLPTLRTLSAKAAERFLSLTLEGVLPLNDLVQEMMC